jgi:hypothetical protein
VQRSAASLCAELARRTQSKAEIEKMKVLSEETDSLPPLFAQLFIPQSLAMIEEVASGQFTVNSCSDDLLAAGKLYVALFLSRPLQGAAPLRVPAPGAVSPACR